MALKLEKKFKSENQQAENTSANSNGIFLPIIETLKSAWNFLKVRLFFKPVTFEQFLEETGKFFENQIAELQKEKQLTYIGGDILFEFLETQEDQITFTAKLYFQNKDKKWVVKELTEEVISEYFSDWETSELLNDLRKNGSFKMQISQ